MRRVLAIMVVLLQVPMLLPTGAVADEFKLTPSVSVRQEYNDNIFFDTRNEEDDFITRIRPGLELINRTERLDLRLSGSLTPFFYWDRDEINAIDQDHSGRVSYRLTPLLTAGAEAGVRVDHQPDRDIETTGLAYGDNRRLQQRYGANVAYQFTERNAARLAYSYGREDWRNASDEGLEDNDSHALTLGLSREVGAAKGVTLALLNLGWAFYDYESSETDYFFGTVGVRHRLTEVFSVSADIGARYTDSKFEVQRLAVVPPGVLQVVTREEEEGGWGGVGHLSVAYTGERTRASLGGSHDINAASGSRGVVQRTGLTFDGGYLVTEKLRLGLFASAFRNKSDSEEFSGAEVDEYSYSLRPSLRWEIFPEFTLEAGYGFTYLDYRAGDDDAMRNLVYVQLAWGLPLFE
jgi:hypothetical protein